MKKSFEQFYQEEYNMQRVSELAQQKLAAKLFSRPTPKPMRRWCSTLFSWPTVLVGSGALAIIVFGIYFSRQSLQPVQTALNTVTHELVDPKVALAESLEYTFGKDSFVQSFGLGDPNEFRYRKIVFTGNGKHPPSGWRPPAEGSVPENMTDSWVSYTQKITFDLWQYKGSARLDGMNSISDNMANPETHHLFISQADQRSCSSDTLNQDKTIKVRCPNLTADLKQQVDNYLQNGALVPFSKNIDSNWVVQAEAEPGVRQVDLADRVLNYQTVQVRFATNTPIGKTKIAYYSPSNMGGSDTLYNTSTYPGYYRNRKEGDVYWHSTSEDQGMSSEGVFYIQFIESSRATPIYEYHAADQSLTAIDYATLEQHFQATIGQHNFMKGLYQSLLMPALYLMQYQQDLAAPLEQASELKVNHATTRLRFELPDSYYANVNIGFGGMPDEPEYIDVWFDSQSNQIVAYNLLNAQKEVMSGVEIQEDYVVKDISPEQFFSYDYWKQAVGLKDENITDEPFIMKLPENMGG